MKHILCWAHTPETDMLPAGQYFNTPGTLACARTVVYVVSKRIRGFFAACAVPWHPKKQKRGGGVLCSP